MRNTYIALILLLLLFAGAVLNTKYLDGFIGELEADIAESEARVGEGDFAAAEAHLRRAIDRWSGADGYTHIFIRHSEINSATDAFYELLSDLLDKNAAAAKGSYGKLRAQLESIATMEHIRLGSIF